MTVFRCASFDEGDLVFGPYEHVLVLQSVAWANLYDFDAWHTLIPIQPLLAVKLGVSRTSALQPTRPHDPLCLYLRDMPSFRRIWTQRIMG